MLTYCIGALTSSKQAIQQLCVCWNDPYRKVFYYKWYESVVIYLSITGMTL